MLDWLIQHQPDAAQRAIGCVLRDMKTGTASRPQRQPGPCTGLGRENTLDKPALENYLERVLPGGYQHIW